MDLDFDKLQENEEFQAFIAKQIEAATEGLVKKKNELLSEVKKLKQKAASSLEEDELEELRKKAKKAEEYEHQQLEAKGEYEALIAKIRKQHEDELGQLKEKLEKAEAVMKSKLVEGGLTAALTEANVKPALLQAAVKLLADEVQVIDENGELVARVGDKTIADFVKEWSDSDVGKNFVLADGNSGGGASGGGSGGGGESEWEQYFKPETKNLTKQYELQKENPELYKKLSEKYAPQARPAGVMGVI